jgi:hypothetical protein
MEISEKRLVIKIKKLWFQFIGKFIPTQEVQKEDLDKNKSTILKLLFTCNHEHISSAESIELWNSVKPDYERELRKRYLNHQMESEAIDQYFRHQQTNN